MLYFFNHWVISLVVTGQT